MDTSALRPSPHQDSILDEIRDAALSPDSEASWIELQTGYDEFDVDKFIEDVTGVSEQIRSTHAEVISVVARAIRQ